MREVFLFTNNAVEPIKTISKQNRGFMRGFANRKIIKNFILQIENMPSRTQHFLSRVNALFLRLRGKITPTQILVVSFVGLLVPCATLLMFPWFATKPHSFTDAFFTVTSAMTVTGLGVLDTGADFTRAGHNVLLFLMEIGGIGQMTFTTLLLMFLGVRMSLKQRVLTQTQFSVESHTNVANLARSIIVFALASQVIGVIVLSFVFVPEFGFSDGVFTALFHAISAFNNAGFSLFSTSLNDYHNRPALILTISSLIIVGGIGFTVITDLWKNRIKPEAKNRFAFVNFKRLTLHSKIMLMGTFFLVFGGAILIFWIENVKTPEFYALPETEKWLLAFFQSVTSRTAGFASMDIGKMQHASIFVIIVLMFIGAGSASAAGGLKISTVFVAVAAAFGFVRKRDSVTLFHQSVNWGIVNRALAMIIASVLVIILATFLLLLSEKSLPFEMIIFEVVSAFSTVGLSIGLTGELSEFGKWLIIFVMIVGRIGPITLFFLLTKTSHAKFKYAEGHIMVG